METIFIATMTVLAWFPVHQQNCGPLEPCPSCVVAAREEQKRCKIARKKDRKAWCLSPACLCSTRHCDTLMLGTKQDGSVVWKVESSADARRNSRAQAEAKP